MRLWRDKIARGLWLAPSPEGADDSGDDFTLALKIKNILGIRDPLEIDRLMRLSGRVRSKWDEQRNGTTWLLAHPIRDALDAKSAPPTSKSNLEEIELEIISADKIKLRKIDFVWRSQTVASGGYLARGKLHILAGPPEAGKSLIAEADLPARMSKRRKWPDGSRANDVVLKSLIVGNEDDDEDTFGPRLVAADAIRKHILVLKSAKRANGLNAQFNLQDHAEALRQAVLDYQVDYVCISPLSAFIGKVNTYRDTEVRQALSRLVDIIRETNVCFVAIMHLNKAREMNALNRLLDSVAFGAVSRIVLGAAPDPGCDGEYTFGPIKGNIIPKDTPSLRYRVAPTLVEIDGQPTSQPRVEWLGRDGADIKRAMTATANAEGGPQSKVSNAIDFLRSLFSDDAVMESKELLENARDQGITHYAVFEAKKKLPIRACKDRKANGRWLWHNNQANCENCNAS